LAQQLVVVLVEVALALEVEQQAELEVALADNLPRLSWRLRWLSWRFVLIRWRLKISRMGKDNTWRQMRSELAGFNPVKLEFWKAVRFPSDEFIDVAVVERFPQVLFLHRKVF
jgi:hypothetical protein